MVPYRLWADVFYGGRVCCCSSSSVLDDGWECLIDPVEYCSSISVLLRLLLLPSPLAARPPPLPCSPSGLVSAAAAPPAPGPSVVTEIGSTGVEKEAAAPSFPSLSDGGKRKVIKN
ncbi:hypothetical protein CesoFtcFv8_002070 [Champsocephalus esox]|uniref:Uncharacterized protein n=1 Tax=Champsocephalus esox TaxID=159716 RepID=A0AAN8HDZ5_9TELE|nr:hypothetical protein CesoFtcFv8_002070 [Champsocephalus esox]